jgi:hypothetical protein
MISDNFVADGFERACAGIEAQVQAEVAVEYAERLASASFWQRMALSREMKAEIRHRVAERIDACRMSPEALY